MTDNHRGALLMIAAMAGFAVEDMFIKAAVRRMPLGEVLVVMGLLGMAAFALVARRRGERALPRALRSRGMVIRSGFEVMGRLFYALAVALTPLTTASAILQATPLVVLSGAALVFGEKVGLQRWLAVLAGFAGVLVILRPGLEGFGALSLLAVAGMIGFAGRDLATRAAPPSLSNAQLGVLGFGVLAFSGAVILLVQGRGAVWPPAGALWQTLLAAAFGAAAYACLTGAMRRGEVSVVTPFRYTRLVFALLLGITVFGERPDAATLLGSAMIVASGLYTLGRSRRRIG